MTRGDERLIALLADPAGPRPGVPRDPPADEDLASLWPQAEMHGVLPAFLANARAAWPGMPSGPALETARRRLAERGAMTLFLTAESRRVTGLLNRAGVPAMVIKGAEFAGRLYASPAQRTFGDMDVLVRVADESRAVEVLTADAYRERTDDLKYEDGYGQRAFAHQKVPGTSVELHTNLVNSPTIRAGVSAAFDDIPAEPAPGGTVRPTPAGLLLITCIHGATSHGFDKLQHLCDVALAARGAAGPIDTDALRTAIERTGASMCVGWGLDLAGRTLGCDACHALRDSLRLNWPRTVSRWLMTPDLVSRAQGPRRASGSWRRQALRQLLKRRRSAS